ncbi:MerR family transcriptional regulator, partial [Dorea formicigenerans]
MSKYYSIHEFSKIIGVSAQTLRNWDENGNIDNTEKSEQQELVEDLVQIITVFSCKLQGKRANKAKKLIRELIQEETDGKS